MTAIDAGRDAKTIRRLARAVLASAYDSLMAAEIPLDGDGLTQATLIVAASTLLR